MAKFQVGNGIDRYMEQLRNLEYSGREVVGQTIYAGAEIVADELRKNIKRLPASACTELEKRGLLDGLGIARMQDDNGFFNVKIGFDGYNDHKTKKYPRGHPNAMVARSIEGGTSWKHKHPFVAPAIRAVRDAAEKKMAETADKIIKEKMG